MEALYLLLVTNKASNILEDLETLRLLSKVVPEYCESLDENGVLPAQFDLLFAFDEVLSLGFRESVSLNQVKTYMEMESHEEKLANILRQSKILEAREEMKKRSLQIDEQKKAMARAHVADRIQGFGSGGGGPTVASASDSPYDVTPTVASSSHREAVLSSTITHTAKSASTVKGMQIGKSKKASDLLKALQDEGELIDSDTLSDPTSKAARTNVPAEDIHLAIEEKLVVQLNRDGVLENMEVKGDVSLKINDPACARAAIKVNSGKNAGVQFKVHPNINKQLFTDEAVLAPKDPSRPLPTGTQLMILKWRLQTKDEAMLPLTVSCWPSPTPGGGSSVSVEYELQGRRDLMDIFISIPCTGAREAPVISQAYGTATYDAKTEMLVWYLDHVDSSNSSGTLEFNMADLEPSGHFFPVSVTFSSKQTLCDLEIGSVVSLEDESSIRFSQSRGLEVETYKIA
eukprot:TRINITY_DN918_c0_g3_i1.p1 TRINITY_DN918_c0_g3~~TRINITY_DN918_c0_g3_i1.p1  ORF type:complete len:527 (-),score=115.41 TRINITY_DN918_c0_g3_i1:980-2356(-)